MADEYGTVGLSESLEGSPVTYHFCYQATSSFDITLNYTFTSTPSGASVTTTYQELGGSPSSSSESITSTSGSESFTLPGSTFCYVKVEVVGTGGTVTTYLS